jgi:hypothetical protein
MYTSSWGWMMCGPRIRCPFTKVPLVDSKSMIVSAPSILRIRACALDTPGSEIIKSLLGVRPTVISRLS